LAHVLARLAASPSPRAQEALRPSANGDDDARGGQRRHHAWPVLFGGRS
jgi:hypothetical protein